MPPVQSYTLGFGGNTIVLTAEGARSCALARLAAGRICQEGETAGPELRLLDAEDGVRLSLGTQHIVGGTCRGFMAAHLLDRMSFELAAPCADGVVLHAGGIAINDRALVFPALSGSGKSTLVAWLSSLGHRYLSDEMVLVRGGGETAEGLARAIHLKRGSRAVLEGLLAGAPLGDAARLSSEHGDVVDPLALGATVDSDGAPLAALVFPRYSPARSAARIRELSPGETMRRLVETFLNARNFKDRGLARVAAIAKSVPSFELTYPSFDGVEAMLEELVL